MDQATVDHLDAMASALNALCNAIREYDRDFAVVTAAVLRKTNETLETERSKALFENLIDVLEFDPATGLQ